MNRPWQPSLPIFAALAVAVHLFLIYLFWLFAFPRIAPLKGGQGNHVSIEVLSESSPQVEGDRPSEPRKLSKPLSKPSSTHEGPSSGSGPEGSDKLLAEIRARIERAKRYPTLAKKFGFEGKSLVRFAIALDGKPSQIALKASSGSNLLDDEALATIQRAAPFPQYPDPLEVWIRFELKEHP